MTTGIQQLTEREAAALSQCLARTRDECRAERFRLLWTHDLSFVRDRVVEKAVMPDSVADQAVLEYRKYLSVSERSGGHVMFSAEVDEVWHAHILFTRDYAAFCDAVFGHFLHHEPFVKGVARPDFAEAWTRFQGAYEEVFGELHYLWDMPRE